MLTRLLAVTGLIVALLVIAQAPSTAGVTCWTDPQTNEYVCTKPGSTQPGDPGTDPGGGSGPAQPTCQLVMYPNATFCVGESACYQEDWHPPFVLPEGPKPQPDSKPMVRRCYPPYPQQGPPGAEIYWSDSGTPPTPPLTVQAQEAKGKLDLALPALSTSPVNRTLVTVPTWFWVTGAQPTQTGSSAFGLVAIATIRSLNIRTGDGATLTCPWTTSAEQASTDCQHAYTQASYDGTASWEGRPAYAVSAYASWDIHFEMNGVRIAIPGEAGTIDGPTSTAVLRVDEVQTIVTDAR
ncbi:hypothetical protein [Nocardioides nematodiphilus]|uniref:hypothetical protein n=1 Tax=Nocardioides nematodiphilus TaxID=2849669 RepID=UPI001CD91C91|nr:hypothetical protein [Nocardioides nematodiphilus]